MERRLGWQRGEERMGSDMWMTTCFFYSSQRLFQSHHSVRRVAQIFFLFFFFFPPKVSPLCLTHKHTDMGKTHTAKQASHAMKNHFLPLLIQTTAKFLGQVEPNTSAGAGLGRNVTGARPLWQEIFSVGKNMGRASIIRVSQREVEEAGDIVAMLLWDSHCVFWDCALPVCLSHLWVPRPLSTSLCVCLPHFRSCCLLVFCTDFLMNFSGRRHNKRDNGWKEIIIILLYFSWDSNPGIHLYACFSDPGNCLLPGKPGRRVMKQETCNIHEKHTTGPWHDLQSTGRYNNAQFTLHLRAYSQ